MSQAASRLNTIQNQPKAKKVLGPELTYGKQVFIGYYFFFYLLGFKLLKFGLFFSGKTLPFVLSRAADFSIPWELFEFLSICFVLIFALHKMVNTRLNILEDGLLLRIGKKKFKIHYEHICEFKFYRIGSTSVNFRFKSSVSKRSYYFTGALQNHSLLFEALYKWAPHLGLTEEDCLLSRKADFAHQIILVRMQQKLRDWKGLLLKYALIPLLLAFAFVRLNGHVAKVFRLKLETLYILTSFWFVAFAVVFGSLLYALMENRIAKRVRGLERADFSAYLSKFVSGKQKEDHLAQTLYYGTILLLFIFISLYVR